MTAVQRRYGPTGPTGPIGLAGPTGPSGLDQFSVNLTTAVKAAINYFSAVDYAMANYVIRCNQEENAIASDFKVMHNGTDIDYVEYASLSIGTLEVDFSAEIVGEDIVLYAQCLTATSENPVGIKIIRTKF